MGVGKNGYWLCMSVPISVSGVPHLYIATQNVKTTSTSLLTCLAILQSTCGVVSRGSNASCEQVPCCPLALFFLQCARLMQLTGTGSAKEPSLKDRISYASMHESAWATHTSSAGESRLLGGIWTHFMFRCMIRIVDRWGAWMAMRLKPVTAMTVLHTAECAIENIPSVWDAIKLVVLDAQIHPIQGSKFVTHNQRIL